jgi:hypothetical protein
MANALRAVVDFPTGHGFPGTGLRASDPARDQSLQSAAAGAFISSSARSTIDGPSPRSTAEGTAEGIALPRSRVTDIAVIGAWGAVVAAALGIVTVRMRQASSAPAPVSGAKASPAAPSQQVTVTPGNPLNVPSATRSIPSVATVQIVERKPALPSPKAVAVVLPGAASTAVPASTPRPARKAANKPENPVSRPAHKPVMPIKKTSPKPDNAAAASAAPPWDDRIDSLGPPETEPEPRTTPVPDQAQTPDERDEGVSENARFKPSVLLGRWQGNIWKRNATLSIQTSDNGSFQGTLTLKTENGPVEFPVQGTFSPVTGRVSFWSPGTPSGSAAGIDLGQENGRLLSTKTMGGVGVDSGRRVYTWSFSR